MLADDQESQSVDQSSEHNQQVQINGKDLANSIKSPHFGDKVRAGVVPIPLEQNNTNNSKNDDVYKEQ